MDERKIITTPLADVYLEDGIVFTTFTCSDINLSIAKAHLAIMRKEIGHLVPLPTVVDTGLMRKIDKEARDFFSSEENSNMVLCSAVIIKSAIARIAGNLYLQFNKSSSPTKLFTDEQKAIEWVKSFK